MVINEFSRKLMRKLTKERQFILEVRRKLIGVQNISFDMCKVIFCNGSPVDSVLELDNRLGV